MLNVNFLLSNICLIHKSLNNAFFSKNKSVLVMYKNLVYKSLLYIEMIFHSR
jgi:hypothetical protein